MIDLSILICSTHTRWEGFGQAIQRQIWDQYNTLPPEMRDRIEIIMLTDNKRMMLGQKRNVMVDMAQGRYVAFVDDDDRIDPSYLTHLLWGTEEGRDVITFLVSVSMNGAEPLICRYGIDYPADENTETEYHRLPNHICAVRRELASQVSFPNIAYGEDSGYSKLLRPLLKTELKIHKVLYYYDYQSESTETQQHLNASVRVRDKHPIVDVIMLSNANSRKLQAMTQIAIRTCIAGANSLPVNVIVLEQQPDVRYMYATTVHAPEPFNYNQFANRGAAMGSAQWIVIANNDLIFKDGWLHHLLAADHPVVSPKNPGDERQEHVVENTMGGVNGTHFSGWCFMIRRDWWEKIGGLDPDFDFWCADDATIEQLWAHGIAPMLVPAARVQHLGSTTLKEVPDKPDLWDAVERFNVKYDKHKFVDDARFKRWKQDRALR